MQRPYIKMRLQLEDRLSSTNPSGGLFPINTLKPGNTCLGVLSSFFPQSDLPLQVVEGMCFHVVNILFREAVKHGLHVRVCL